MHEGQQQEQSAQRYYLPELDTLRFFAFLSVFLCHAAIYTGRDGWLARSGGLGVDLFFALSAFLISELLLREKARYSTVDVRSFWIRRILRIWPLYFATLAVAFSLRAPLQIPLSQLAAYALFVGNFVGIFTARSPSMLIGALWSVSVEEQFYLTWPMVARRVDRRGTAKIAIGLCVVSLLARSAVVIAHRGPASLFVEQATICRLDSIAIGLLLSAMGAQCTERARPVVAIASAALVVLAGAWLFRVPNAAGQVFAPSLVAVGCGGLLVASIGARWMRVAWTGYLGRISYGLYVFHEPGLMLARIVAPFAVAPAALAITLAAAATAYRYLERPFLKLKERFQYVRSQPLLGDKARRLPLSRDR